MRWKGVSVCECREVEKKAARIKKKRVNREEEMGVRWWWDGML